MPDQLDSHPESKNDTNLMKWVVILVAACCAIVVIAEIIKMLLPFAVIGAIGFCVWKFWIRPKG